MEIKIEEITKDPVINFALYIIKKNKQALIFLNTRQSAEKKAEEIAAKLKSSPLYDEIAKQAENALENPTKQCKRLAKCLRKGVAFHHAGLVHKQRDLIETNFRKGIIKIICATPTLAYGLDLPAYAVLIRDVKRYAYRGMQYIPKLEFEQMAGRAGRPNYDNIGLAIALAKTENEKDIIEERYIFGDIEEIQSKLANEAALRMFLLSIIASEFANTEEKIIKFFSNTFWAFQFKDIDRLKHILKKLLFMLRDFAFIEFNDFASVREKIFVEATEIGKRVSELYIDPLTAYHLITCLKRAKTKIIEDIALLQAICNTTEMRPLLNVKAREYEYYEKLLLDYENELLDIIPSQWDIAYDEFLASFKTAMLLYDWINEATEEEILEKYNLRPGELYSKIEIADWLLYSLEELARILKLMKIISKIKKLRLRLKYGAKEELLALLKLEGIGRIRARKLYNAGIKDIGDVKKASLVTLSQIIGKKMAENIKKQVEGKKQEKEKETKQERLTFS